LYSFKREHITLLVRELHWLWSRELVDFKLTVFVFQCLHNLAPRYLAELPAPVLVIIGSTDCETNATGDQGHPCHPSGQQSTLEHSATRRHFCSHTACFLQSFKVAFV